MKKAEMMILDEVERKVLDLLHDLGGCGATDEYTKGYDSAIDLAYDEVLALFSIMTYEKKAIKVGYEWALISEEDLKFKCVDLVMTKTIIYHHGTAYNLFKGATYEDSRKLDELFDRIGSKPIKDFETEIIEDTTYEWCSECERDIEIDSIGISVCPNCKEKIIPCSICCETTNCSQCIYEKEKRIR